MLHKNSSLEQRHPFHNWEVADTAALTALPLAASDVGKVALQLDTLTFWVLRDDTGPIWAPLTGFATVLVGGQPDIVLEDADDALTLVAGSNMAIVTDPILKTATFNASGSGGGGGVGGDIVLFERFRGF